MFPTNWKDHNCQLSVHLALASSWVRKTHWKGGCGKVHVVSVVDHEEFETGMITSPVWDLRYARVGVVEVKSRDRAHVHTLIGTTAHFNLGWSKILVFFSLVVILQMVSCLWFPIPNGYVLLLLLFWCRLCISLVQPDWLYESPFAKSAP